MARHYLRDADYRIGASQTTLIRLKDLGIGNPDQSIYQPSSVYYTRADLSRVGDGYSSAFWVWDMMAVETIAHLTQFLNGTDSATVYIRTDLRNGDYAKPSLAFKNYRATMWRPLLFGQEGTPVAKSPYAFQTVQFKFMNLVEVVAYL